MSDDYYVLEIDIIHGGHMFRTAEGEHPADGQPHLTTPGKTCHWVFREWIHQWFVEQNIAYELGGYRTGPEAFGYTYQISFENKSQAALFKLTFV